MLLLMLALSYSSLQVQFPAWAWFIVSIITFFKAILETIKNLNK